MRRAAMLILVVRLGLEYVWHLLGHVWLGNHLRRCHRHGQRLARTGLVLRPINGVLRQILDFAMLILLPSLKEHLPLVV